jgi:hypothetical protein
MLAKPKHRGALKGKIHERGHRTIKNFPERCQIDQMQLSRVLNSWEFPSGNLQKKTRGALDISTAELEKLL